MPPPSLTHSRWCTINDSTTPPVEPAMNTMGTSRHERWMGECLSGSRRSPGKSAVTFSRRLASCTLLLTTAMLSGVSAFSPVPTISTSSYLPINKASTHVSLFSIRSEDGIDDGVPMGASTSRSSTPSSVAWEVYVDQSKMSLERGAAATLDSFVRLSPPDRVRVIPAVFAKPKVKGPIVRCVPHDNDKDGLEVSNVDSVDKVFRLLTRHMRVANVNVMARECLKWKYIGNGYLEEGEAAQAIDAYDRALATNFTEEEGVILLNRATAYLQTSAIHKSELQQLVSELAQSIPEMDALQLLYEEAVLFPDLSGSMFQRVVGDAKRQQGKFRKVQHRHGLYQHALLHAAQDGLRATELLPAYSKSWLRAGEILSELWKLNESAKYYEKAIEVDESLESTLSPVVERLRKRQELLNSARAYGWSEDALRLALDVAG